MIKFLVSGASSSMAEHRTVDAGVEGSKPFWHPSGNREGRLVYL